MGKVVKIVAGIAIAAGAIALAAPTGGLSIAAALGVSGVTAAAVVGAIGAAIFATAATFALNALIPTPSSTAGRQPSRAQQRSDHTGRPTYPPGATQTEMPPVDRPWWRGNEFWPWARFGITRVGGDCLKYTIKGRRWWVTDRHAPIRAGDLFLFEIDDMADYVGHSASLIPAWMRAAAVSGMGKRFVGVDPVRRVVVYEHTFPPNRIESGLDRVKWAYRVRAIERSYFAAVRTWWAMRRNPEAYGARLGLEQTNEAGKR